MENSNEDKDADFALLRWVEDQIINRVLENDDLEGDKRRKRYVRRRRNK